MGRERWRKGEICRKVGRCFVCMSSHFNEIRILRTRILNERESPAPSLQFIGGPAFRERGSDSKAKNLISIS